MEFSDVWNFKKIAEETTQDGDIPSWACVTCKGSGIDFAKMKEIHQNPNKDFLTQFVETLAARCKACGGSGEKNTTRLTHNKERVIEDHADDHSGEIDALHQFLAESLPLDESSPSHRRLHMLISHSDALKLLQDKIKKENPDAIPTDQDILEIHDGLDHTITRHDHSGNQNQRHIMPVIERLRELGRHLIDQTYWEPGQSISETFWDGDSFMRPEDK